MRPRGALNLAVQGVRLLRVETPKCRQASQMVLVPVPMATMICRLWPTLIVLFRGPPSIVSYRASRRPACSLVGRSPSAVPWAAWLGGVPPYHARNSNGGMSVRRCHAPSKHQRWCSRLGRVSFTFLRSSSFLDSQTGFLNGSVFVTPTTVN